MPTDTVYGLAVDPRSPGAVERIFAVKGRPEQLALPVLIADPAGLASLAVVDSDRRAARFALLARPAHPRAAAAGQRSPSTSAATPPPSGSAARRARSTRELLRRTGPLAVTSANRHGESPLHTAAEVREHFGAEVASVLDGGRCDGRPSTVVSLVGSDLQCLREGALPFAEIAAASAAEG